MLHFSRWRMFALIASLVAACAPALPTSAPTNAAVATSTTAAPATVVSAADLAALRPGDVAPDFSLPDSAGTRLDLASVVAEHQSTVLIFYLSHT